MKVLKEARIAKEDIQPNKYVLQTCHNGRSVFDLKVIDNGKIIC